MAPTSPKDVLSKDFFKDGKARPLKFGKSFLNESDDDEEFHSVLYDFKPPGSDKSTTAIEMGSDNNVSITVRQDTEETTVYKGSVQEASKDCFLIIDRVTGEITLERVSSHIRVKRTREPGNGGGRQRPATPQDNNQRTMPPVSESMPDLDFGDDDDMVDHNGGGNSHSAVNNSHPAGHNSHPAGHNSHPAGNNSHPAVNGSAHPMQQQQHQSQRPPHLSSNGASSGKIRSLSESSSSSSSSSSSDSDSDSDQGGDRPTNNATAPHNNNNGRTNHVMADLELSSEDE